MKGSRLYTRRQALLTGLASVGGLMLPGCSGDGPPTYGNLLRMGDNLTYGAHKLLLSRTSLAKEYERHDISSTPAVGTANPADPTTGLYDAEGGEAYDRLLSAGFGEWRLSVMGSVDRPTMFSLDDLKRLPSRTQITKHMCEEGWSAIAEWTGVPLRTVLEAVGMRPSARWVQFHAYDAVSEGIDMIDALHPQTILAYGMNGRDLPIPNGAPVRLRVERQIGYKSIKFIRQIVVTDRFDDLGERGAIHNGWSWYVGI